jgi:hypothetical protein
LLAHGRWFSPGTPASSTTKTGRHDIVEILLKVSLKHQKSKSIKSKTKYKWSWELFINDLKDQIYVHKVFKRLISAR